MFQLTMLSPSLISPNVSATMNAATQEVPQAPSGATARPVDRATIRIEWSDNSRNEEGFRIEVNAGRDGVYAVPSNATGYTVSNLRPDQEYCFSVKAFNRRGNSNGADACAQIRMGPTSTP
jgi:hypothetical protein